MSKVALLFLTYGNILHRENPKLKEYLQKTNVYIHPKNKDEIEEEFKSKMIPTIIETSWGTDTIVIATLSLLKEAYKNEENQWFVLCSEDIFPLRSYNKFHSYLQSQTKSLFSDMDKSKNKTEQWWALKREDVELILSSLQLITNNIHIDTIKKQKLYKDIGSTIPRKAAWDELFFLAALKKLKSNYQYKNRKICYTKWFDWISKHPTIFNKLLPSDKTFIETNSSCFFIRKTFPTFQNDVITKSETMKDNCIIVVIGTENKDIQNYTEFLTRYKDNSDIFLLIMTDMKEIKSEDIKRDCCQCYSVVYNVIKEACDKIKPKMIEEGYNEEKIFIIQEEVNANTFVIPESVPAFIEPPTQIPIQEEIWEKHMSSKHNKPYWFNPRTGKSVWIDPSNKAMGFKKRNTKHKTKRNTRHKTKRNIKHKTKRNIKHKTKRRK